MAEETRGEPSSLKGPLADVFIEALLGGEKGPLLRRLGNRAKVVDPVEGRASGLVQLEPALERIRGRIAASGAVYEKGRLIRGVDRDVAEGTISLATKTDKLRLPVATLVQRGKAREVELRLYYASKWLHQPGGRSGPVDADPDVFLPKIASDLLKAITAGKVPAAMALLEATARLTDPQGTAHERASGALEAALGQLSAGGLGFEKSGTADDGRSCAIEGNVSRVAGKDVATHPMLLVFERGDSGLFTAIRVYRDDT